MSEFENLHSAVPSDKSVRLGDLKIDPETGPVVVGDESKAWYSVHGIAPAEGLPEPGVVLSVMYWDGGIGKRIVAADTTAILYRV